MNKKTLKVILFGFLCATTMNKADASAGDTVRHYGGVAWDGTKNLAKQAGKGLSKMRHWMSDKIHSRSHNNSN